MCSHCTTPRPIVILIEVACIELCGGVRSVVPLGFVPIRSVPVSVFTLASGSVNVPLGCYIKYYNVSLGS